jgi:diamine N-acetyltransferase
MKIRAAKESDIPSIAVLLQQVQDAHVEACPHHYIPVSKEAAESFLRDQLNEKREFVVAVNGNAVLGYAILEFKGSIKHLFLKERQFGYLHQICVDAKVRGQGIGKALLKYVREVSAANGIEDIELDVWVFNDSARKLFEKSGFEVCATKMRAHNKQIKRDLGADAPRPLI